MKAQKVQTQSIQSLTHTHNTDICHAVERYKCVNVGNLDGAVTKVSHVSRARTRVSFANNNSKSLSGCIEARVRD